MKMIAKQSGQAIVFVYFFIVVVIVGVLILFNSGQLTRQKMEVQNAADAAAYSAAVLSARYMNYAAYTNRAMIANEVGIGQFSAFDSWSRRYGLAGSGSTLSIVALKAIPFSRGFGEGLQKVFNVMDKIYSNAFKPVISFGKLFTTLNNRLNWVLGLSQQAVRVATLQEQSKVVKDVINDNAPGASLSNFGALAAVLSQLEQFLNFSSYTIGNKNADKVCGGLLTLGAIDAVVGDPVTQSSTGTPFCPGSGRRRYVALVNDSRNSDSWLRNRRSLQAGSKTLSNFGVDINFRSATMVELLSIKNGYDISGGIRIGQGSTGGSSLRFTDINPYNFVTDLQKNPSAIHRGEVGWSHLDTIRLGLDEAPKLKGKICAFSICPSIDIGKLLTDVGVDLSDFLAIPLGGASAENAGSESQAGTGFLGTGQTLSPYTHLGNGEITMGTFPASIYKWIDANMLKLYGGAWTTSPILQPISAIEAVTFGYKAEMEKTKKPKEDADEDDQDPPPPPPNPTKRAKNYKGLAPFTEIERYDYSAHKLDTPAAALKGPAFIIGVRKNISKLRTSERVITNPKKNTPAPSDESNRFNLTTLGAGGTGNLEVAMSVGLSDYAETTSKAYAKEQIDAMTGKISEKYPSSFDPEVLIGNALKEVLNTVISTVANGVGDVIGEMVSGMMAQKVDAGNGEQAIYAIASARIFYHNPGTSKVEKNDPGSAFSPYWEARMVPVDEGVKKWAIKTQDNNVLTALNTMLAIKTSASTYELNKSGAKNHIQYLGTATNTPAVGP